jgi:hypothetical protein
MKMALVTRILTPISNVRETISCAALQPSVLLDFYATDLDLVLQPEENRTVFLKLIAIEVHFLNCRGVLIHEQIKTIDGLHTPSSIKIAVD